MSAHTPAVAPNPHMFIAHGTLTERFNGIDVCIVVGFQMSSLSRDNDKDSFRLSWGAEHLDNVVLSSSLLHSGLGQCTHTHRNALSHTHTHTYTQKALVYSSFVLYVFTYVIATDVALFT